MAKNSVPKRILLIIKRECKILTSRPLYLFGMIIAPIFTAIFFLSLMDKGLPEGMPVAVIDQDNSKISRSLIRQLDAFKQTDVIANCANFGEARELMQKGDIYGIYYIPKNFEKEVTASMQPKVSFYTNNSYLIAGSLLYKDLKTISVLGTAAVGRQHLLAKGATMDQAMTFLQPISTETHLLGNPWSNYSVYLCNIIIPGILNILVMLVTIFAIGTEIKSRTAKTWLRLADGDMFIALIAKLIPHTLIYFIVITFIDVVLYEYLKFPCNSGLLSMLLTSYMLILDRKSFVLG